MCEKLVLILLGDRNHPPSPLNHGPEAGPTACENRQTWFGREESEPPVLKCCEDLNQTGKMHPRGYKVDCLQTIS